jgi:hypothetical protein
MVEETKQKQDKPEPGHNGQGILSLPPSLFTFNLSDFRRHRCHPHHCDESPMMLHTMLGVALFLFWQHHRARPLHVLNTVDNLPCQTSGKDTTADFTGTINDWRVAIAWVACRSPTLPSPATSRPSPLSPSTPIARPSPPPPQSIPTSRLLTNRYLNNGTTEGTLPASAARHY